jgi:quercetin dioxygenase-like cupin family protein
MATAKSTCRVRGGSARRLSPAGFSIFLDLVTLDAGGAIEWGTDHGDDAGYVISGALEVGGRPVPTGAAIVVESGVGARATATEPSTVAHFGPVQPGEPRGRTVHVVGPRGRFESAPGRPFFRFFADSTCETCDAFLLYSQRDEGWSVTPHSHSADELIYVLDGTVMTGRVANPAGECLAYDAGRRYALAAPAEGFVTLNYRASPSTLEFADLDGSMLETAANVGGVEVDG